MAANLAVGKGDFSVLHVEVARDIDATAQGDFARARLRHIATCPKFTKLAVDRELLIAVALDREIVIDLDVVIDVEGECLRPSRRWRRD